jgi:hypothetical protein
MTNEIRINREETNTEVLARIVKAVSKKYNCSVEIDFQDGKRTFEFVGDEASKSRIAREVQNIFDRQKK